jgi:hypothetical protein
MRAKRIGLVVLVLVIALTIACVSYVVYLGRYMVYTADGAHLELPSDSSEDAAERETVSVPDTFVTGEAESRPTTSSPAASGIDQTTQLPSGYYADLTALQQVSTVQAALEDLLPANGSADEPFTVMLDLKSEFGNFYYSTGINSPSFASVDIGAVDDLIAWLDAREDVYLIARLPALRDNAYALSNTGEALALSSGALWQDSGGCYWLDPASDAVRARLISICADLAEKGFDEVVFENFSFPDSDTIVYDEDRQQAIADCAEWLVAEAVLPVSFTGDDALTCGAHVCLEMPDGSSVSDALSAVSELQADPERVLFLTTSRDTRFSSYCQLRPVLES